MKRVALLLTAALMVFSFGLAYGDSMHYQMTDGFWNDGVDKVTTGKPIVFTMHQEVTSANITGQTNGFELFYSLDAGGATYDDPGFARAVTVSTLLYNPGPSGSGEYDGGFFYNEFSNDGIQADTIGWGGFAIFGSGFSAGFSEDMFTVETQVPNDVDGLGYYLCIDSAFYPPGGEWLWSGADGSPTWNGPTCWPIEKQPNEPAVFDNCPTALGPFDHCDLFTYQFQGTDPDPDQCDGTGDVFFSLVDDGGLTGLAVSAAGELTYQPTLANVAGGPYTVVVAVEDACAAGTECSFTVSFTNQPPTIACKPEAPVGKGQSVSVTITADDVDCDPGSFSLAGVTPAPVGTYDIDPNTGVLTFNTDELDAPGAEQVFTFTVEYSDGAATATCEQDIRVLFTEPYEVWIEKTHGTYQGGHEYVDVSVTKGSEGMWGFDFLIAYDASALSFQTAVPGDIYDDCGWEYFTYRYGASGNCDNACPSGLLRVIGIAETNNGANHPGCFMTDKPFTLFTLDFLVTDDRTFECMYVPVRFFWMDCGDNAISFHETSDEENPYSQKLAISRFVYDGGFGADPINIADGESVFPTYNGAPDVCLAGDKDVPVRFIDFYNGGIDIVCADSIDARGDINLNGVAYEISDAVLYSNYFVYGIGVFSNYQAQVAASDVNADGIPLSVADLVYLVRVVVGDALPYPKVAPVEANIVVADGIVSVDREMGAASLVVEGNVTPTLLADNMEMKYAYDANEGVTRILVISYEQGQTFNGAFVNAGGNVVSTEFATYDGAPVAAKELPTSFAVAQNYPNPFNPTTTISFTLPQAGDYKLTIYNVTGQVVEQVAKTAEAGTVEYEWNASDMASGIYFYNVETDLGSVTKKMVLLK